MPGQSGEKVDPKSLGEVIVDFEEYFGDRVKETLVHAIAKDAEKQFWKRIGTFPKVIFATVVAVLSGVGIYGALTWRSWVEDQALKVIERVEGEMVADIDAINEKRRRLLATIQVNTDEMKVLSDQERDKLEKELKEQRAAISLLNSQIDEMQEAAKLVSDFEVTTLRPQLQGLKELGDEARDNVLVKLQTKVSALEGSMSTVAPAHFASAFFPSERPKDTKSVNVKLPIERLDVGHFQIEFEKPFETRNYLTFASNGEGFVRVIMLREDFVQILCHDSLGNRVDSAGINFFAFSTSDK